MSCAHRARVLFFALFRVKSVFLHAMANNTAALGLYHSFGFHEVSIVARFYQLRTENSATASSSDGSSSSSSSSSSLQEQPGGVGPALVLPWSRGSTPSTSMPEPAFADALLLSLDLDSWASSRPPPLCHMGLEAARRAQQAVWPLSVGGLEREGGK